ncbi:MAG: hypothetical protein M3332_12290 [Actinomycetota bacterium]|nr:hypothetical protein [Actinomycetota bacterium]
MRTIVGLDAPRSEKVAYRARAARQAVGRLSGHAAGEVMEVEAEQVVLLDDVRQVVGVAKAMHLPDVIAGLARLRPQLYGSLTPRTLGGQLRQAGVEVGTVHVAGQGSAAGIKGSALDVSTTAIIGDVDHPDNVVQLDGHRTAGGDRRV